MTTFVKGSFWRDIAQDSSIETPQSTSQQSRQVKMTERLSKGRDFEGTAKNRHPSWLSYITPLISTSRIVAISVFLLSSCFPALSWLPMFLIFAYFDREGRLRERRRGQELDKKEEEAIRRLAREGEGRLWEELARLSEHQIELKMKLEEKVAYKICTPSGETSLTDDLEDCAESLSVHEGIFESSKDRIDANEEEKVNVALSKLEESLLLKVGAKLEHSVEKAVILKIGEEKKKMKKSLELEEMVERAVGLRFSAEMNQFQNSGA